MDEVIRLLPLRTIGTKEITDKFIELDMKGYNRSDLLSMRGVALEIAAITGSSVNFKEAENFIWKGKNLPKTKVEVEDEKAIPVYCIAKIEGLKVGPSPKEWVEKLEDSGMRSIDCITDVTNLVMLEYGQPMHAFDANIVADETLIVRHAKPDEALTTLDNKPRKLIHEDLVIADPEKPLGLAGVIGGKNSEVTPSTTTILLEAAIFDPVTIRKTATRLALQSEASKRFRHGLTKKRLQQALDTAIKMYESLGGKLTAITLKGNLEDEIKILKLHQDTLHSLVGIKIPPEEIKSSLEKLNFTLASKDEVLRAWEVKVPYFRLDAEIEADLIEEVARMHGYETIPAKPLAGELPEKADQKLFELIFNLKKALVDLGLTEIQTYSYYSTSVINNFSFDRDALIQVANPMSAETEYMRDKLWPNLLEKVAENLKYTRDIAVFEIGKIYYPVENNVPQEKYKLAIALSSDNPKNIQELHAILQSLASHLTCGKVDLGNPEMNEEEQKMFHPVRFWQLTSGDQRIGEIAEVHPRIVNRFGTEKRVSIIEIEIEQLLSNA